MQNETECGAASTRGAAFEKRRRRASAKRASGPCRAGTEKCRCAEFAGNRLCTAKRFRGGSRCAEPQCENQSAASRRASKFRQCVEAARQAGLGGGKLPSRYVVAPQQFGRPASTRLRAVGFAAV